MSEWVIDRLIEYVIFLHGLAQQWRHEWNKILHTGSLGGEDDAQTSNTHKYMHNAEKSHDTTLNDEKYAMHYRDRDIQ